MNIYVGNLARDVSEEELRQAFSAFGTVDTVNIIKDRFSGDPRGFAFVEMPKNEEAQAAIQGMHMKELKGRSLDVNEARPKREHGGGGNRPFRGGGGGSGQNRGSGGGGGGGRRW